MKMTNLFIAASILYVPMVSFATLQGESSLPKKIAWVQCHFNNSVTEKKEKHWALNPFNEDYLTVSGSFKQKSFQSESNKKLIEDFCLYTIRAHHEMTYEIYDLEKISAVRDSFFGAEFSLSLSSSMPYPQRLKDNWAVKIKTAKNGFQSKKYRIFKQGVKGAAVLGGLVAGYYAPDKLGKALSMAVLLGTAWNFLDPENNDLKSLEGFKKAHTGFVKKP
jgi:hypothetical protein